MSSVSSLAIYVLRWAALPLVFLGAYGLFRTFYLRSLRLAIYPGSRRLDFDTGAGVEVPVEISFPLRLQWTDAHTRVAEEQPELTVARAEARHMRTAFGAAGVVYLAIAAVMMWRGATLEGSAPTRAIWLTYVSTGSALIVILGFLKARWVSNVAAVMAWFAIAVALRVGLVGTTWQSATQDLVVDALRILTPPALTVGLLMLRRFRPLLVALVPAAVFIGVVSIVVGLLIQGVVPGGSGALFAARPAWFSNWMLAITPLPTIAGIVIAVREIRRGVRRSVLLMLVALLIVAGIAATAGSPVAVLFAGVCVGVAINAFEVFAVWAIVTGFLRLKQRGDLPDEVLHFAFCWLALTWFTAVLAGDDRPYLGWSMLPFASCMGTLLAALAYQRRHAGMQPPKRMLLLRVFGSARTRTRLFDLLDDIWLRVGRIEVIVGLDLALRTLSALALGNYFLGRVGRHFLRSAAEVAERLPLPASRPGLDGRYPFNELYCAPDVWPIAVGRLVSGVDVVLMDLRGLRAANTGALYEMSLILQRVSLSRIVVLTDAATDERTLAEVVQRTWQHLPHDSPNRGSRDARLRLLRCSNRGGLNSGAIEQAVFDAAFDSVGARAFAAV